MEQALLEEVDVEADTEGETGAAVNENEFDLEVAQQSASDRESRRARGRIRQRLIDGYDAYQRKEPGSMDRLLLLVREFAFLKVSHLEYEFHNVGTAETADDWAQEVCIKVWQSLPSFKGGSGSSFYAWVHRISFTTSADAFNTLKHAKDNKEPLLVSVSDDDSEDGDEEMNPILTGNPDPERWLSIPDEIQGVERNICWLIINGNSYAEIAKNLRLTEKAVRERMYKLRKKMKGRTKQRADA